jgi:sortase (surface protein transpeptidase)
MFWNLHRVRLGDVVEVELGPGRNLVYRVRSILPSVDYRDLSYTRPTAGSRLTLQTCNGWGERDPRFIVIAERE